MIILKEGALGILGVILTIFFEFITLGLLEPHKFTRAGQNFSQITPVFAVQFDLLIIAVSILLGFAISSTKEERGGIVLPLVVAGFMMLPLFALPLMSRIYPSDWLRIIIPDLLAAAMVVWSIHAVINGRKTNVTPT